MKVITLKEWVERGKQLPGRRLLESEEDDIIRNILDLISSPDPANLELAEQIAKGQFEEDNPAVYKQLLGLFNHDMLKQPGMYFKKIEKTGHGDFNLIFNSTGNVRIPVDTVKNGKLIYHFDKVDGWFDCSEIGLTTLEGCPQIVGGGFYCVSNQLKSLKGCPKEVGGSFWCYKNKLTSLEGAPQTVGGDFHCSSNKLTTLKGCPKTVGAHFHCAYNQLTSLEGAPQTVGDSFDCQSNKLTSLEGCPQTVGSYFICSNNKTKFTEQDVRSVCDVKGRITV